ncbi:FRG domain-containing protein [Desertibaculum subflavum]|uniref:FRG domain-containing protein n=1 Tax=Desertibaculum subflavum TaxID=2268458 RepID=UPI000E663BBE
MAQEYILAKPEDLLNVGFGIHAEFGIGRAWWRGHARSDWPLVPSVFRSSGVANRGPRFEMNISNRFVQGARIRRSDCPPRDDHASWLLLMQHFGLPTRMLDWSESLLVALYFAVSDDKNADQDGIVWALHPTIFNEQHIGRRGFAHARGKLLNNLHAKAFNDEIALGSAQAAAVDPPHGDLRMLIQKACYTIQEFRDGLETLPGSEKWLRKIVVPHGRKDYWGRALGFMGLDQAAIFPDLQNLASHLSKLTFEA